jgi:phosphohistidine phosphatase
MEPKILYLMRHGDALPAEPSMNGDFERTLSPVGVDQVEQISHVLKEIGFPVEHVLCSAAYRTRETAMRLFGFLALETEVPIEPHTTLYNADVSLYQAVIQSVPDSIQHLMVVGHNPTISALATCLNQNANISFMTANMAAFQLNTTTWKSFACERGAELLWKIAPDN